jgi:hypothetical protein
MPQDRLLHPKASHSAKVTLLTDFEYRVWTQYMLSADDFGVMRASVVTLQADNDAIHARPARVVERALEHVIAVALVKTFEHQGRRFLYQYDWQTWQKVEYPRATLEPVPPSETLALCDAVTQLLFGLHPGGKGEKFLWPRKKSPMRSETSPNESGKSPTNAGAQARVVANASGYRLTQEASAERTGLIVPDDVGERAGRFLEKYAELYAKHRHGAKILRMRPALDWDKACNLCQTWDDARLEKMAVILLTTNDDWIAGTDRGFGVFVARAQWCDERLAAWEADQRKKA